MWHKYSNNPNKIIAMILKVCSLAYDFLPVQTIQLLNLNFCNVLFFSVEFLDVRFFLLEFSQFTFKLRVFMTIGRFRHASCFSYNSIFSLMDARQSKKRSTLHTAGGPEFSLMELDMEAFLYVECILLGHVMSLLLFR